MTASMTTGRLRQAIDRDRTGARVGVKSLGIDDEASGWLAPETIVAQAFHEEDQIGRLVASERRRKSLLPAATGLAMSTVAVVFTAAILLALLV